MAIAFDTTSDGGASVTTSPLTWTHTTSGTDRILFVQARNTGTTNQITGITYNSVAMTQIQSAVYNGNAEVISLYYLINPASGANTVSVSFTVNGINCSGCGTSYTGADQASQPDSSNTGTVAGTTLTVSTTVVAANCWLVGAFVGAGLSASAGTGTTLRVRTNNNTVWNLGALTDSNGTVGTGSQSQQAVDTYDPNSWAGIVASFDPAPDIVAIRPILQTLLGVR